MPILQESIHKLEVAGGMRYLKLGLAALAIIGVIALYNIQSFKNMGTQEAMDSAQLARNIAQGKGYTTSFVRPFSMYLFKRHNEMAPNAVDKRLAELSEIKNSHPDISNPPVYPIILAGLMKVLPFHYPISDKPRIFWTSKGEFWRYQPDFFISVFNQLLFFAGIVAVYFLAKRFFDTRVALTSAALLFGAEVFWRFSVSGLSTMLLFLIFVGIVWCLVLAEEEGREMKRGIAVLVGLAIAAGLLTGMGGLTRYSFGWLILPVLAFFALFGGQRRWLLVVAAFVAFAAVMTPWVVRNELVSGTAFGTSGYAIFATTPVFPEFKLERSIVPDFAFGVNIWLKILTQKLLANSKELIQSEFPRLGGNWIGAFFLVGLLVGFANLTASRIRYFLLMSLPVLLAAQALGHTQLSEESKQINSENLLVLASPLVLLYGVSFFYLLLDQIYLPIRELRYVIIGAFCVIACLPMLFALVPAGARSPLSYPPYHPPSIQRAGYFAKPEELTMSDIPWAMAWYGQRQCVWLTQKMQPDFSDINDLQKPIMVLFLTRVTLDSRIITDWLAAGSESWPTLILETTQFMAQRDAEGKDNWPKRVELRVRQMSESTQSSPMNLGAQGLRISYLPFHFWQRGWPDFIILTTRDNPVSNESPAGGENTPASASE
jgi:Dolichyl-phosphate-mannose-protein mannosyltransferase